MVKLTYKKEEILEQAKKLQEALSNTEEVQFYQLAEEKINANVKVSTKLAQIKQLQKQAVNFEHYQKYEAMKQVEENIECLQTEIDELPVVVDFKRAQKEANDLLQMVTTEITRQMDKKMSE